MTSGFRVLAGSAAPGIRLRAFATAFQHHTVHPICTPDLVPAMQDIAAELGTMLGAGGAAP
jgi:hypothetical protein